MSNLVEQIADEVHIKLASTEDFLSRQEVTASVLLVNFISYHKVDRKEMIGYTHNPILLM